MAQWWLSKSDVTHLAVPQRATSSYIYFELRYASTTLCTLNWLTSHWPGGPGCAGTSGHGTRDDGEWNGIYGHCMKVLCWAGHWEKVWVETLAVWIARQHYRGKWIDSGHWVGLVRKWEEYSSKVIKGTDTVVIVFQSDLIRGFHSILSYGQCKVPQGCGCCVAQW